MMAGRIDILVTLAECGLFYQRPENIAKKRLHYVIVEQDLIDLLDQLIGFDYLCLLLFHTTQ
jgi:hypothetical protein